jgi:mannitol-specific phosphotransferase system IIBC component
MQYFISIKHSRPNYYPLVYSSMHELIIPCILYMLPYLLFLAYSSGILVKDSRT